MNAAASHSSTISVRLPSLATPSTVTTASQAPIIQRHRR
jgi:hypothetical protein